MKNLQFKQNENSEMAWKRNGLYGRVKRYHTELKQLLEYPLTDQEKGRLLNVIVHLNDILIDKNWSDKLFGQINGFKKYQNEKI